MDETQVLSWGQDDPLEKEMASILAIQVFLPGKSNGQRRSLAGYSPWVCKELDMA